MYKQQIVNKRGGGKARKPKTRVRKPQQSRAKETILDVLEAAGRVVVKRGYARTTTNHIAREAGISIGSLYQYFGNKESVVKALLERHIQRCEALLMLELEKAKQGSLAQIIEHTVRAMFEFHCDNYELSNVLHNELPREGQYRALNEHYGRSAQIIETFMLANTNEVSARARHMAPPIVVHALTGAFFGTSQDMKRERGPFLRELQDLILLYLTAPRSRLRS